MANICSFRMRLKGEKENISKFFSALTQAGNIWMGRGAEADIDFLSDNEAEIEGCCKWSIQSALSSLILERWECPFFCIIPHFGSVLFSLVWISSAYGIASANL